MFSKNLKYYRLKNSLSRKDLAKRINVSPMAITNYENGDRQPSMEILKLMAKDLGVKVSDFLSIRNENLVFCHGEFRKNSTLPVKEQEYIHESVEEYFNRFMTIVEVLGGEVLPAAPKCHVLHLSGNIEDDARSLRQHLSLAIDGPIEDLIGILENKGVLIYVCDIDNNKFSGINGFLNEYPYVVFNKNMTPERNRSTVVHELSHLMFIWPEDMPEKEVEATATAISGAFLFPKTDVIRELGVRRTTISKDMELVAKEYGISMFLLVKRAEISSIISSSLAKEFYINASQAGWRKNEPSRIKDERSTLFAQLVFRAASENEISIQRGAELLKIPYDEIVANCCISEV